MPAEPGLEAKLKKELADFIERHTGNNPTRRNLLDALDDLLSTAHATAERTRELEQHRDELVATIHSFTRATSELRATAERLEGENKTLREDLKALEITEIVDDLGALVQRYQQALEAIVEWADSLALPDETWCDWCGIGAAAGAPDGRHYSDCPSLAGDIARKALASSLLAPLPAPPPET